MSALFLIVVAFFAFALQVSATGADPATAPNSTIEDMNADVLYWYFFIRNYISVPILIISFASCGYKFLSCAFMGKPEYAQDNVVKQMITSVLALLVLFALPAVMTIAKDIVESTAWSPAAVILRGDTQW